MAYRTRTTSPCGTWTSSSTGRDEPGFGRVTALKEGGMPDVITFGEAMIRLAPPDFERLEQASTLKVSVGGSELTVAAGVARLGLATGWVSRLPDNALGRMAQNKAREFGVDTSHLV